VEEYQYCFDCFNSWIITRYKNHYASESNAPPREDIRSFEKHLDPEFVKMYHMRMEEYQVPVKERHFCPHHVVKGSIPTNPYDPEQFASIKSPLDILCPTERCNFQLRPEDKIPGYLKCLQCGGRTHAACGEAVDPNWDVSQSQHQCPDKTQAEIEADPFDGLTRGKDYQVCPGCSTKIELAEACNHMEHNIPSCNTSFCFICGEHADGESAHWASGIGCPRYGHPDEPTAVFDDPMPENFLSPFLRTHAAVPAHTLAETPAIFEVIRPEGPELTDPLTSDEEGHYYALLLATVDATVGIHESVRSHGTSPTGQGAIQALTDLINTISAPPETPPDLREQASSILEIIADDIQRSATSTRIRPTTLTIARVTDVPIGFLAVVVMPDRLMRSIVDAEFVFPLVQALDLLLRRLLWTPLRARTDDELWEIQGWVVGRIAQWHASAIQEPPFRARLRERARRDMGLRTMAREGRESDVAMDQALDWIDSVVV
jgi:hypothetical protein